MHNLFGDTHSVVVNITDQGESDLTFVNEGDTVEDMMRYVHIDVDAIRMNYRQLVSQRVAAEEQTTVLAELEQGLSGYTYLEDF